MKAAQVLSRAGVGLFAVLFLCFGLLAFFSGIELITDWSALGRSLALVDALMLLSGAAMIVSAIWIFATLGRKGLALWTGASATFLAGAVILIGTISKVIPCGGPT